MRRIFCVFLCFCLLSVPVFAAQDTKYVALTFDDGPSGKYTRRLLDGLQARNVKATFFLCGYRLKDYPKEALRIFEEGHEIGLHGYSHENMGKMSYSRIQKELRDTQALLPEGCCPAFLRPPGGASNAALKQAAQEADVAILNWSVDPRDWENHDAMTVEAFVTESVQDGDVILLHDMCDCSVDAALRIIDKLQKQGFRFVTVSELARIRGVDPQPGVLYNRFG